MSVGSADSLNGSLPSMPLSAPFFCSTGSARKDSFTSRVQVVEELRRGLREQIGPLL
jgi:hypothetical protein